MSSVTIDFDGAASEGFKGVELRLIRAGFCLHWQSVFGLMVGQLASEVGPAGAADIVLAMTTALKGTTVEVQS